MWKAEIPIMNGSTVIPYRLVDLGDNLSGVSTDAGWATFVVGNKHMYVSQFGVVIYWEEESGT
ncbi:hypothetical protein LCGC14_2787540, partial [marine sediment metagenome]